MRSSVAGVVVCCALAVLGIRSGERACWISAEAYSLILSKLIKVARFLVMYKATLLDKQAIQAFEAGRSGRELRDTTIIG